MEETLRNNNTHLNIKEKERRDSTMSYAKVLNFNNGTLLMENKEGN